MDDPACADSALQQDRCSDPALQTLHVIEGGGSVLLLVPLLPLLERLRVGGACCACCCGGFSLGLGRCVCSWSIRSGAFPSCGVRHEAAVGRGA